MRWEKEPQGSASFVLKGSGAELLKPEKWFKVGAAQILEILQPQRRSPQMQNCKKFFRNLYRILEDLFENLAKST